jgi:hypothetical protein
MLLFIKNQQKTDKKENTEKRFCNLGENCVPSLRSRRVGMSRSWQPCSLLACSASHAYSQGSNHKIILTKEKYLKY